MTGPCAPVSGFKSAAPTRFPWEHPVLLLLPTFPVTVSADVEDAMNQSNTGCRVVARVHNPGYVLLMVG